MMSESYQSPRTTVKRLPQRGAYDQATVHGILDQGLVCHVGFVEEGTPFVIPTIYVRIGEQIFLHGSKSSRMLRALSEGAQACITVTLVDGLVLARSAFHHSINYRSVVVLGTAVPVVDASEKSKVLHALSEHIIPGRWQEIRVPTEGELNGTAVVGLTIHEASAKIRMGPPKDDEEDYALPIWAGILPLLVTASKPVADPRLSDGVAVPEHVAAYARSLLRP